MERVGGLVEGKGGEKRGGGRDGGGVEQEREGEVPPQKMQRTDMFPFRMLSFSHSEKGPTFYNNSEGGRLSDLYDVPGSAVAVAAAARIVQPFPAAFESPGMASLRFPFTSAQWQELEQQALIYKYMMAAVPIPPDLLIPIRKSLANAAVTSQTSLGWGSYNLRLAGNTDPEPGRCRRTDGKKWRCSRDVAPDQKYCERHMHRGRPRSRKPVEVQIQNKPLASSQTRSSSICAPSSSLATLTCTSSSPLGTKPSQPCGVFLKPSSTADFKLPLQSLVPAVPEKGSRYLNLMKGGGITDSSAPGLMSTTRDPMTDNQQLKLLHSKLVPAQQQPRSSNNGNTSIINYQDYLNLLSEPDLRENHHFSGFNNQRNDHQSCHFLGTDLGSFDPDCAQRHPSRRFIDAWSQSRDSKSLGGKLSLSSLSLSMSRGSGEDIHPTQMGLGVNDSERDSSVKPQPINWMLPVSWQPSPLGGPLAEVLQSSKATANSPPGRSGKSLIGGGLNLMSDGWGEVSPRNSPKLVSSPTGVLQKTLASLSDSSSGSSPTFAAKSEMALQWLNQQHKLPS